MTKNEELVLAEIQCNPMITRYELFQRTGLDLTEIAKIVRTLQEEGIIRREEPWS